MLSRVWRFLPPCLRPLSVQKITTSLQMRYASDTVTVKLPPFKLYNIKEGEGPPSEASITKEEANLYLYQMVAIRRLEQTCAELYREKKIRGFCHLYTGEEAIAVGVRAAMRDFDDLITAYRCHGWAMMMGAKPEEIFTELTGKIEGMSRGKGGSMHLYTPSFYGGNGIVGAHVPLGAGVAMACKFKKKGGVCFTLYGDGAANQGQVYETYNMACLWQLPVIFCCENNHFGLGTHKERATCDVEFYMKSRYLPGIWVDGMNVLAVRTAAQYAIEYASKNGPMCLEFDTYRYFGHSMSDPGTAYRTREDVKKTRDERDCIQRYHDTVKELGLVTEEEWKAYEKQAKQEMAEAVKHVASGKDPDLKELTADVYYNCVEQIRGTIGYDRKHFLTREPFIPFK